MRIDDIRPYERNARHNEKAIPVVAESIRQFGLKGQIVLESRDNPVIVAGHTRWAACKELGWTEIPDERIDYCDGMTEEEIKAYRLADNRTGEIATWNATLLQHEIKSLGDLDMSKFKFDFKGKQKPHGAARFQTDDYYNLGICGDIDCNRNGMPELDPTDRIPDRLLGFNYAKSSDDHGAGIHFFIDDYQFERVWNSPERYIDVLSRFDCVLTPDFSLYMDMPLPMKRWNVYRSRVLGMFWQRNGLTVIPTLQWAERKTFSFCFDGLPENSVVAVSTVGVKNDKGAVKVWHAGMREAMKRLEPSHVLLYGGDIGFDFDCEVTEYSNNVTDRMSNGQQRTGKRDLQGSEIFE